MSSTSAFSSTPEFDGKKEGNEVPLTPIAPLDSSRSDDVLALMPLRSQIDLSVSRILIVDDEPMNVQLIKAILRTGGYSHLTSTTNPLEVRELCEREMPDLVLLDLRMPQRDGYAVLADLQPLRENNRLPVLVVTADVSSTTRCRALAAGARDFITKPVHSTEVLLRVHNLLETVHLERRLHAQNVALEDRVQQRTAALEQLNQELQLAKEQTQISQMEILERLAQAAEFRDDDTGQHTQRVGETAARIAEALGWTSGRVEVLRLAARLHDVGKIGIPDHILLKPGRLSTDEFAVVQQHPQIGARLLENGRSALIHLAQSIALSHHERFDGRGYPYRLVGDDIPLEGRIVAVADVFDALTHDRPYKAAWSREQALQEIERGAGAQFDARVVGAFTEVFASL